MINTTNMRRSGACFLLTALAGWPASAEALVIDAVADTWIRESTPATAFPDDLISVWDGTTTDLRRHGIVVFDLSDTVGVNIDTAFLQLFDRDEGPDGRSETSALVQQAFVMSPTPGTFINDLANVEAYTWDEFTTFDEAGLQAFESLGNYDIPEGDLVNGYDPSDFASTADINLLEQIRDNNSNHVVFVLQATAGERDWGDIELEGTPPQLVINEGLSVTGDFTGDGLVTTADFDVMVDSANWLQTVAPGTLGDITADGVVNLADFNAFKPIFLENNPQASLALPGSHAVPEPKTLGIALLCVGCALLAIRLRRSRPLVPGRALRVGRLAFMRTAMWGLAAIAAAVVVSPLAQAITLEATTDVWIREADPDRGVFESDLVSVWNSFSNDGARRYGVLEFDLSSLEGTEITFVGLQLWDGANGFSDDSKPIRQSAVAVDTTGGTQVADWTWNIYQSEFAGGATQLEGLGLVDQPEQTSPDAFVNSVGTEADRAFIESIASAAGGNKTLTMVLIADEEEGVDLAHSWGDGPDGFGGMNAQLVINDPFPENVELTLQIDTATGNMSIVNPGIDPREDTTFDLDGYTIQSPAGALNPAGFTGLSGEGEVGWQIVPPDTGGTAGDLSEVNLTMSTLFSEGDAMSLGTAYMPGAAEDPDLTFEYSVNGVPGTAFGEVEYITSTGVAGDYNGDGVVDAADYTVWRDNLGASTSLLNENPNATTPGVVDAEDYEFWKSRFGATSGSASLTSAAVPEPTAQMLLALLAVGAVGVCRCSRGHLLK